MFLMGEEFHFHAPIGELRGFFCWRGGNLRLPYFFSFFIQIKLELEVLEALEVRFRRFMDELELERQGLVNQHS